MKRNGVSGVSTAAIPWTRDPRRSMKRSLPGMQELRRDGREVSIQEAGAAQVPIQRRRGVLSQEEAVQPLRMVPKCGRAAGRAAPKEGAPMNALLNYPGAKDLWCNFELPGLFEKGML